MIKAIEETKQAILYHQHEIARLKRNLATLQSNFILNTKRVVIKRWLGILESKPLYKFDNELIDAIFQLSGIEHNNKKIYIRQSNDGFFEILYFNERLQQLCIL